MAVRVTEPRRHRVLLLNFSEEDVRLLNNAGFNSEVGYVGELQVGGGTLPDLPYWLPRPVYDYDVSVFNSGLDGKSLSNAALRWKNLLRDKRQVTALQNFRSPPHLRITFTGGCDGENDILTGVPFLKFNKAHENVSLLESAEPSAMANSELHALLSGLKHKATFPVRQYVALTVQAQGLYPIYHHPVLLNRNNDRVAVYGTVYDSPRTKPIYVVLPQLKDNAAALAQILRLFAQIYPELLPGVVSREWYTSNEFAFREEKAIDSEIAAKVAEAQRFIEGKREERNAVGKQFEFIRELLVAAENDPEPNRRLSTNVRKALEFLGFKVEDMDAKVRGAIKKEDFWVRDGKFLAITEVSATKHKNPKTKEYSDLLGRMTTVLQRKEFVPDVPAVTGLLILNYDIDNRPFSRPKLYSGGEEEYVAAARETQVGLLSTVELYKIAIAVKDSKLSKQRARELIKGFGRIELLEGDPQA